MALGKTLAEIDCLSAGEFAEWQAYYQAFPFGDERADWRMGMIVSTLANVNSKRGGHKPTDFMLKPPKTQAQTDAELKATMRKVGKGKGKRPQRSAKV